MRIQDEVIPTIVDNPIKCLGKWFDESLTDRSSVKDIKVQVQAWLKKVDGSGLPGKYKVWIYQHGILPRLMWPILIYEVAATAAEAMERAVNGYLRRCMVVPPSFTSIGLYSKSSQLQLALSSVVEEFKVAKCRLVMTLRDSNDTELARQVSRHVQGGNGRLQQQ